MPYLHTFVDPSWCEGIVVFVNMATACSVCNDIALVPTKGNADNVTS